MKDDMGKKLLLLNVFGVLAFLIGLATWNVSNFIGSLFYCVSIAIASVDFMFLAIAIPLLLFAGFLALVDFAIKTFNRIFHKPPVSA